MSKKAGCHYFCCCCADSEDYYQVDDVFAGAKTRKEIVSDSKLKIQLALAGLEY